MPAARRILFALSCVVCGFAADHAAAADVRADFLKIIDRPRVPLAAEVTPSESKDAMEEFHFTYASDAQNRVPGILVKPKAADAKRWPVVIALHGTGGKKADELPLLRELAGKGFIGVAIDGRYHGERSKEGKGSADYQNAIVRAFSEKSEPHEHPFYFDTVWDVMRLIDYLETRDDVDKERIGLIGFSKGGIETYLTAAVDPRVAVAVPCIGLESFRWALDNNAWQGARGNSAQRFQSGVEGSRRRFARAGICARVLFAAGAGHRRRIRWAGDDPFDCAAADAGNQRRFGRSHAAARFETLHRRGESGVSCGRRGRSFCSPHRRAHRPQGEPRRTGRGGRMVCEMAETVGCGCV